MDRDPTVASDLEEKATAEKGKRNSSCMVGENKEHKNN